ncbi:MAG TPA: AAA family ATPase [Kofleriaceae bacterium]|nr:AAA family ATPase [Kofleriaceae bacterium]
MHKQINQLRASLMAQFPERKDSLAAVLAGEHVLLIGTPGTAKSTLVRCLAQVFGGSYFERLLTKFSTPEELFGPISLQALAQDRFVRITAGKLPETEFAALPASSASSTGVVVPRSETGKTMPFQSLRHSFGTECARRGVPVMTLRDLMGHAYASMTQRYVTVTSADKRSAIERTFGQ